MEKFEDKMAFFTKIFQNQKHRRTHQCKWTLSDQNKGWSPPSFCRENVRLIVIVQNHDQNGGRVLFDSKSEPLTNIPTQDMPKRPSGCRSQCIFKSSPGKPPCTPSRARSQLDNGTPRRLRLSSDVKLLEEMMFGSAPIIPKASSLKVHTTKNQLMVTKLFLSTDTVQSSGADSFDLYSLQSSVSVDGSAPRLIHNGAGEKSNSLSSSLSAAHSVPVDIPLHSTLSSDDNGDSGFSASMASSCSSNFTTSGYSPSSSASMNSLNSLTRRLQRNQNTSLEYGLNKRLSDDTHESLRSNKRPSRLGIGLTFTLPEEDKECFRLFEQFFFSHITLIESHVVKLKVAVEEALETANKLRIIEALDVFRSAVYDLYTAPRLSTPIWLNMMQSTTHQMALSSSFLKDFISVIEKFDTKSNKFFMSTLITAVLTHHLAWVPTVTPVGATPSRTYLDKHSAKWLDALAKSHPYNPLWAQLGDLYGAISVPLRLSRTLVVGQKADVVCKLLRVLSYFIRCSEVRETSQRRVALDDIDGHVDIPGTAAMSTIEEDGMSVAAVDTASLGKLCGSATSSGTVRHLVMQTSTESGKSDKTVISAGDGGSAKNRVSFSSEPVIQADSCGEGDRHIKGRVQLDGTSEDHLVGNAVFYCCLDNVEAAETRSCRCNFDLYESSSDIIHQASVKALKLFRMLSEEPEEDRLLLSGEDSTCESSFCDKPVSESSLIRPAPLHATPALVSDFSKTSSSESISSDASKKTVECRLSPDLDPEKSVAVQRLRHVGRAAVAERRHTIADSPTTVRKTASDQKRKSSPPLTNTSEEQNTLITSPLPETTLAPSSAETPPTPSPQPTTPSPSPPVSAPAVSPKPSQSTSSLYPSLSLLGERPPATALETALRNDPSLHEEPGCIRLRDDDPGTLYPRISGDTLITPLRTSAHSLVADNNNTGPNVGVDVDDDVFEDKDRNELGACSDLQVSLAEAAVIEIVEEEEAEEGEELEEEEEEKEDQEEETSTRDSVSDKVQAWLGTQPQLLDAPATLHETNIVKEEVQKKSATSRQQKHALADPTVSFFGRSNSMFDEYFENSVPLPDVISKPSAQHDGDDGDSMGPISLHGPLSVMDQYFTDDLDAVTLRDGPSKEMLTSTIDLIQEAQDEDDDDVIRVRSDSESSQRLIERQLSGGVVSRQNSLGTATPARCRSTTPTELGLRRHLSATSNISWDLETPDAINNLREIPMPRSVSVDESDEPGTFDQDFGHSLMAGYTDHYMSDFVLHGTNDNNFLPKLRADLAIPLQNSVLGEPLVQTCCIVADTDKSSVKLHTCQHASAGRTMDMIPSQTVSNILESVLKLHKMKMSPEFCLMHLEDRLQEIYFKSKMLAECILAHQPINNVELTTKAGMLGLDGSDLPLLLAVAGTHTSNLAHAIVN